MTVKQLGRQFLEIQGEQELLAKLDALTGREAGRISRKALITGARMMRDAIRDNVPKAKTKGHSGRDLKNAIGARLSKSRKSGQQEAKAGVQVGKRKKSGTKASAPHLHLIALGTKQRWTGSRTRRTKRGSTKTSTGNAVRYRGRMPADDFVKRTHQSRGSAAVAKMISVFAVEIEAAAKKGAS